MKILKLFQAAIKMIRLFLSHPDLAMCSNCSKEITYKTNPRYQYDAVASLLGLIDKTSYEGEAAMLLKEETQHYFKK
jgi:hydrogenase maturation factor HypF (carbamoyltransferase family)